METNIYIRTMSLDDKRKRTMSPWQQRIKAIVPARQKMGKEKVIFVVYGSLE